MCCSLEPAKLTNTILYAAEALHEGHLVHVLGYQNRAENQFKGPNAMLLPIPSDVAMGPANMLDTTAAKHILTDYADAVRAHHARRSRSMKGFGADSMDFDEAQVFDKGSYTVALADNAKALTAALARIPSNTRPAVKPDIFAAYDKLYPGWKMALCAWDGTLEAEPLLWWYEPKNAANLFLPALDAHDGHPPKLASDVDVDHCIVVGSVTGPSKKGLEAIEVRFQDALPEHLKPFLASTVAGYETAGRRMKNGDFSCKVANVHKGLIDRVPPPGQA